MRIPSTHNKALQRTRIQHVSYARQFSGGGSCAPLKADVRRLYGTQSTELGTNTQIERASNITQSSQQRRNENEKQSALRLRDHRAVIHRHLDGRDQVILYGHPCYEGVRESVLRKVFGAVLERGYRFVTMQTIARRLQSGALV